MLAAMQKLHQNWQVSPTLQAEIINNFNKIEDNSMQVAQLLDTIVSEKKRYETSMSHETGGAVDLF